MKYYLIFLLLLFSLGGCMRQSVTVFSDQESVRVFVEIADALEERRIGLMNREFLDENSGMLFIFEDSKPRTFLMKNTLIPLDMIFIDENFNIVDIKHAKPCKQDPCVLYISSQPAQYVLEVNGDFTTKNNIKTGNKMEFHKK